MRAFRILALWFALLACGVGAVTTWPRIDSGAYWPLVQTPFDIRSTAQAINDYALSNHRLPPMREASPPSPFGPVADLGSGLRDDWPRDVWHRPFIYKVLDPEMRTFVVYSAGPDGKDDGQGGDDVIGGAKEYDCKMYQTCPRIADYAYLVFAVTFLLLLLGALGYGGRAVWRHVRRRSTV